ncbi:BFAR [Bugula neritina]|uniref:BFAR n=1 Tax=Bugula neritina TaxID=10212 RepID=A0A7J7JP92_BUGNE|nr:BFAR [Bugula neritina]
MYRYMKVKFCALLKMQSFSPPDVTSSTEMLEEEFVCGVCCDLMVIPTTLNCGHSFCRHCLARWFDVGKKTECPICRKSFAGCPMENKHMMNSLEKLFEVKYRKRKEEVLDDKDNKQAIQEFEKILEKRHRSDNLSATSCGFLMGIVLVLLIIVCFYMAFYWGSGEFNLLVKKPLIKWTVTDVESWLEDQGLQSYREVFRDVGVNGRMLSEVEADDLESMFNMTNSLHRRMFLHSLNHAITHGVKQPTNLWEYKALNSAHAVFLLYCMNMTPRLCTLYLYRYDYDNYVLYRNYVQTCNVTAQDDGLSSWLFQAGSIFMPHYIQAKFVYCFKDVHYWTSRILLMQCLIRTLLDLISIGTVSRTLTPKDVLHPIIKFTVYYLVSSVWWILPTIIADAIFYLELYFGLFFVINELYNKLVHPNR